MSAVAHEENPYAGQGSVLLDIGGDVGALIVTMPADLIGIEIEIEPVGQQRHESDHGHEHANEHAHKHTHGHAEGHSHRPHVAVVGRPVGENIVPSLVFPDLVEGSYALFDKGEDEVLMTVEIRGGEVTTAVWPL